MDEIMEEYGGLLIGVPVGILIIGIVAKLILSGGLLGELLTKLGNMAC